MISETYANGKLEDRFDVQSVVARWSASHREAADRILDAYETTVGRLADAHVERARAVELPAVTTIAETQASLSRGVAEAYVRSVRKLLEP
jgi:hypothetical protein